MLGIRELTDPLDQGDVRVLETCIELPGRLVILDCVVLIRDVIRCAQIQNLQRSQSRQRAMLGGVQNAYYDVGNVCMKLPWLLKVSGTRWPAGELLMNISTDAIVTRKGSYMMDIPAKEDVTHAGRISISTDAVLNETHAIKA